MKRLIGVTIISVFLLIAFTTGCTSKTPSTGSEPMAFIEKVEKGEALVKHATDKDFAKAEVKTSLFEGDIVKTAAGGEAVIRFSTGAVARVLPDTEFQIKERKVTSTGQAVVYTRLVKGVAAFYVPKDVEAAKKFEVETERAVASIKGTTFKLADDGTTTTLSVGEGIVSLTAKSDGKSVEVKDLYKIACDAKGLGEAEKFNALMDPDLAGAENFSKGTR